MKKIVYLTIFTFIFGCSLQHAITPEHYNYIQAKNQLTTDYALISGIEHTTTERLKLNQISVSRAKSIDFAIKGINFKLDLAQKLLEAGNYKTSLTITKTEYKKLQILLKSLQGEIK